MNRPRMSLTRYGEYPHRPMGYGDRKTVRTAAQAAAEALRSTEIVGTVTEWAALMTGLAAGTPVTGGTIDTVAATIGAGAVAEGDFSLTIGSSGRLCSIGARPMEDPRLLNICGAYDGQYIIVQSTNNACVSLRWFRDTFGREAARQAQAAGCGIYHIWTVWRTLPRPGPEPYMASLSGRGAEPVWDTRARGVFLWGRAGDRLPILYKGCPGGSGIFTAPLSGSGPGPGCQTGYHTPWRRRGQQPLWCRIFADVLGIPVARLRSNETETLGDIIIAAQAMGIHEIAPDFGKVLAAEGEVFWPDDVRASVYDRQYRVYRELYQALKPVFAGGGEQ